MPYVNIKITREGATAEQKARLIEGVTRLLVEVLDKNPQTTVVVIDEVDTDNWGIGGESVTLRRRAANNGNAPGHLIPHFLQDLPIMLDLFRPLVFRDHPCAGAAHHRADQIGRVLPRIEQLGRRWPTVPSGWKAC